MMILKQNKGHQIDKIRKDLVFHKIEKKLGYIKNSRIQLEASVSLKCCITIIDKSFVMSELVAKS